MKYADDIIIAGPADEAWRELQAISKVIKLTSMYLANDFLGIVISEIQSGPRSFYCTISQAHYAQHLLSKFKTHMGVAKLRIVTTPSDTNVVKFEDDDEEG